ncbi:D-amino acid dehydrogenase [Pseudooctadecabacter jejudonensis]|uniref:D-amino acid dehydrogenase small subunit n=1 Tax=Pseudooctadecabacter jejudonensis TaxID=1391910 RepID=A0A1Y5R968_9RHOB|nr:D-amino acid dehydrogenase [Pseudooctadecabacter jejudonensis]SLN11700.1 D-amino acid dehydrogenase small subunit [Pseudooctadecabacter jejudonensis]
MRHIAVIGAGITGITTAYALLNRGFDVTVFDKNRYAAMETSFANGGQLSASNAEVWTQWSTIFKGLKWMTQRGAPLLVNPKPSWHKYSWMAEFMGNIPNYRANTVETVRLAIKARDHLKAHAAREGFAFDCEQRGILHVYNCKPDFDHATKVTGLLAEGGLERHAVTVDEMRKIEPALQGDLYGGYYTESDFTGDIHAYARGLGEACKRRGVAFHYGAEVATLTSRTQGVDLGWADTGGRHADHFDGVVICAGCRSRDLARQVGDRVNIYPVKGYSITVNMSDDASRAAAPWVSLLDDKAKIVTSRLGPDRFRVAGTAEFNGYNKDIRDDRIQPLVKWVEHLFPQVSTEHAVPWAGLRPMMPNMMPRVGAGKQPGVFYNTGHGHLGWTLSAATAELVADDVLAHAGPRLHVAAAAE